MASTHNKMRIVSKSDTELNWQNNNPILLKGEVGYVSDLKLSKIGDGVSAWNTLSWLTIPESYTRGTLLAGLSVVTNAAITAADNFLGAFGKLQAQITALEDAPASESSVILEEVQLVAQLPAYYINSYMGRVKTEYMTTALCGLSTQYSTVGTDVVVQTFTQSTTIVFQLAYCYNGSIYRRSSSGSQWTLWRDTNLTDNIMGVPISIIAGTLGNGDTLVYNGSAFATPTRYSVLTKLTRIFTAVGTAATFVHNTTAPYEVNIAVSSTGTVTSQSIVYSTSAINLTNYTKLGFIGSLGGNAAYAGYGIAIYSTVPSTPVATMYMTCNVGSRVYELDVSALNGSYYIGVLTGCNNAVGAGSVIELTSLYLV